MKYLLIFFLLFNFYSFTVEKKTRRKRILHFPEKTNVVLTMSLLKLFPSETILNTLTEYDVLFPVPLHPYKLPNKRLKREIERNVINEKFETITNLLGFKGQNCLKTVICEMKKMLSDEPEEDNLLRDIMNILFNLKNGDRSCTNESKNDDCSFVSQNPFILH